LLLTPPSVFACFLVDVPTELGRDLHLPAHVAERFADHDLVGPRTVCLGRVEEIHAEVDGLAQQGDHLGPVGYIARLSVAHRSK
jgi:hypothetical protein